MAGGKLRWSTGWLGHLAPPGVGGTYGDDVRNGYDGRSKILLIFRPYGCVHGALQNEMAHCPHRR